MTTLLSEKPNCFAPVALVTSVITTTTADISWNDTNTVTAPNYEYSYGAANFAAGTGTQMTIATDSVTVSGLTPSTNYDWYVRAICGPGDTSLWSSVASFTTACVAFVAPITESFDGTTIPVCWSQSAVQDGPWVFGTPGFGWNTQGCTAVPTDNTGNSGNFAALDFSGTGVVDVVLEMNDVDVSGLTAPYIDFYFWMCGNGYTPINILYVESFDGTNWNLVDSIQEHTNGWKRYGFSLAGATYSTNLVKIRFRASSAGNTVTMFLGDQAIDDVTIGEAPAVELRALEMIRPISGCGLSATDSVEFSFVNEGSMAQTSFDVTYSVNGIAITPETVSGTILPGDTMNYVFQTSIDLSVAAVYNIQAYTGATSDFNTTNDTTSAIVVSTASSSVFPYSESFESGSGGWLVAGNAAWELGAPAGVFIDTASDGTQAWMTDLDANYPDGALGYVISPCFDFSSVDYPYITMDIWYDIESQWDGSLLESSIDGGLTWTVIGDENDPNNWYNDTSRAIAATNTAGLGSSWTGNGSISGVPGTMGWINAQHELYDLAGEPNVQLRMLFASDANTNDDGMAFDNVNIIDSVLYAPIGDINQNTATGTAASDNEIYFTSGIVMGVDLDGNGGYLFTLIDMASGSQEGVGVFSSVDVSAYVVTQGDSIMIRGEVGQFRGLTQLTNIDSIAVIASNVTIPTPIEVTFPSEGTESKWIKINNVHSLEVSGAAGNNNNHDFNRGTDTLTVRVDRDTDLDDSLAVYPIAIGDSLCSVVGIGGQFTFAANLDDGYQIIIHRYSDIDTSACSFIVGLDSEVEENSIFSISPNPSRGEFILKTDGFVNPSINVTIRDINGRIVSNDFINNANSSFNKSFDLNGESKGVYFITITDGNNVINEKLILQ
ncbi:MAG: T9SS type A sorting domain-containing protein [Flavobacteriales bacterium]|nr:T9SS type A sorting domain-containing protein [Flavobacteriales bacterium]